MQLRFTGTTRAIPVWAIPLWALFLSVAVTLIRLFWVTPAAAWGPSIQEREVRSYRELRYERVVGQTSWITCGPAAVATLLTHYVGIPADEGDVLRAIAESGFAEKAFPASDGSGDSGVLLRLEGYSMLDLKRALGRFGVESAGYRLSEEVLKAYFDEGGLPVVVHLTKPEAHFAVLVGYLGDRLVLADPSFGERVILRRDFVERHGFSGYALVAIPRGEELQGIKDRQDAVLRRYLERHARLGRLGAFL